jgi:hypothetical protein
MVALSTDWGMEIQSHRKAKNQAHITKDSKFHLHKIMYLALAYLIYHDLAAT